MKATYTKLKKEDAWGIRVQATPEDLARIQPGYSLEVEKKDGSLRTETIETIVFRGSDFLLARPKALPRKGSRIGT